MAYGIGGGGSKAPDAIENPQFSLVKPGDITNMSDPGQVALLDEMLQQLYESHRLLYTLLLAGNVIAADGTASASVAAETSVTLVTRTFTETEFETLDTAPIEMVAAPASNKILVPISLSANITVTSGYGTSPSLNITHRGRGVAYFATAAPSLGSAATVGMMAIRVSNTFSTIGGGAFDPRGKALDIYLVTALSDTGAISGATASLLYYEMPAL